MLDVGQAVEIKAALRRECGSDGSSWTNEKIKRLTERKGFLGLVLDALEGRATIVPHPSLSTCQPGKIIDRRIRVNRSVRPVYPDWADPAWTDNEENFIKLEVTGPSKYDLADVILWRHDFQVDGHEIPGEDLYQYLRENQILESCLSLHDGEEIQKKGIALFRQCFGKKTVLLAKSTVMHRVNFGLDMPYLFEKDNEVAMGWIWLGEPLRCDLYTLRFPGE